MSKSILHLYIERDLSELAKKKGINLSHEFTEYLKTRLALSFNEKDNKLDDMIKEQDQTRQRLTALDREIEAMKMKDKKDKDEQFKKFGPDGIKQRRFSV